VSFCALSEQNAVLDLGCGRGATIQYLLDKYSIKAVGIDPSKKLLQIAKEKNPSGTFVFGSGEDLSFKDKNFDCVFAECTLSLMHDVETTLKEVHRVLKADGWFIITDVYAKNPQAIDSLQNFSLNSCVRGLHELPVLQEKLEKRGFEIMLLEDCSHYLKELMVKIIFSHGSMSSFWKKTMNDTQSTQVSCSFEQNLKQCKPGYFMIIARKKGD
jgi:ubiquinone/menaquinone biosynthesis C-methylase UbiE